MASREYWQKRFIELEKAQQNKGVRYYHDLEKQYSKAARAVDKELTVWYSRLAVNNEVSMTEARKMLTGSELEEFRWSVEEYIEKGRTLNISKEWSKQLENASARWHISRLEAMKLQMQQQVEVLYGNELDSFDRFMREIYTDSYYGTAFEIQKGVGIGHNLAQLDTRKIDKVMSRPWAPDGSNFSSRIWKQKTQLVNELNNVITQSFIRGQSPDAAIKHIADRFLVSKGKAANLVMTETAFFHSAGQKDMFKELGVQEYEIVATLDNKTSEICQSLDGTHRPMSEYEPGVTAPPFHCRCRSTTVPYFDDEFTENEVRAARGEDGKTYHVPSDMTYREWKKSFVGNTNSVRESAKKMNDLNLMFKDKYNSNISEKQRFEDTLTVSNAYKRLPTSVKVNLPDVTFEIGHDSSACDIANKTIRVGIGAEESHIHHEYGHLIEKYMMNKEDVDLYKKYLTDGLSSESIIAEIYYDNKGNEVPVYLLKGERFETEYQARLYVKEPYEALNSDGTINIDVLGETISEPFRKYMNNETISEQAMKLIKGALK